MSNSLRRQAFLVVLSLALSMTAEANFNATKAKLFSVRFGGFTSYIIGTNHKLDAALPPALLQAVQRTEYTVFERHLYRKPDETNFVSVGAKQSVYKKLSPRAARILKNLIAESSEPSMFTLIKPGVMLLHLKESILKERTERSFDQQKAESKNPSTIYSPEPDLEAYLQKYKLITGDNIEIDKLKSLAFTAWTENWSSSEGAVVQDEGMDATLFRFADQAGKQISSLDIYDKSEDPLYQYVQFVTYDDLNRALIQIDAAKKISFVWKLQNLILGTYLTKILDSKYYAYDNDRFLEANDFAVPTNEISAGSEKIDAWMDQRHQAWVDPLLKMMASQPITVAVGLAHLIRLPGSDFPSLLEILVAKGAEIRPIEDCESELL